VSSLDALVTPSVEQSSVFRRRIMKEQSPRASLAPERAVQE
jgi:hypothetical protein